MTIESEHDLVKLMKIGRICGLTVQYIARHLEPGITTRELDRLGADFLEKHGARSAPIVTYKFPGATCISINDEVAHGIPGDRVVQAGDMVNIDVSAELEGYFADTGASFIVPPIDPVKQRLCDFTRVALDKAIDVARSGSPINVIGKAIESEAKRGGYSLIRELGGHGIGRGLHEEPRNIPNFYHPKARFPLHEGLVMTIEPFLCMGKGKIYTDRDGWTLKTIDGTFAAQYEHTIVITKDRPILVTAI
ncbi:MAG: type I methionyl aminopeptidase [Anaerolineae bacterium]|jgi:methionyl aminopeptidase|nr:type I methionyl aminopeptidase [Anaerolineae bacterium]